MKLEAAAFLKACNEKPYGLIFEFALLSGKRPEGYLALQWRDFNFEHNTAQVRRALVRHKKVWRFHEPKTKGSKRSVTIPASLSRKLAVHKRVQVEQRLKMGNEWQAHDLVFCSEFGTPLSIPNLTYRYFRPILEKAGLPQIRCPDAALRLGVNLTILQSHISASDLINEAIGELDAALEALFMRTKFPDASYTLFRRRESEHETRSTSS